MRKGILIGGLSVAALTATSIMAGSTAAQGQAGSLCRRPPALAPLPPEPRPYYDQQQRYEDAWKPFEERYGDIWDNFTCDYEYPGGRFVSFQSRHLPNTLADVGNVIHGSKGTCHILGANGGSRILDRSGKIVWEMKGSIADAYKQEHKALIDSGQMRLEDG